MSRSRILTFSFIFLVLSQITRFENEFSISCADGLLGVQVSENALTHPTRCTEINSIGVTLQRSMVAENGVRFLEIRDDSGARTPVPSGYGLYLFGHDIGQSLVHGEYPEFRRTFGDWTMDRFRSNEVVLDTRRMEGNFTLRAVVAGRGESSIILRQGEDRISVNLRDGYIDNDLSICVNESCPAVAGLSESILQSTKRILNFGFEVLFLGLLLCLPVGVRERSSIARAGNKPLHAMLVVHFTLCFFFCYGVLGGIPHIPDAATYLREAILIASGNLNISNFPYQPIEAFAGHGAFIEGDTLSYHHSTHFWPLLLSIGVMTGLSGVVNPLLSALSLYFLYGITLRLFDRKTAIVAGLLYALSPFTIILGGSFMSHTATQCFLLGGTLLTLRYRDGEKVYLAVLSGVAFGYAFGIRPLTAVSIVFPLVLSMAFVMRARVLRWGVLAMAGALPVTFLLLADNYAITGSFFASPLSHLHGLTVSLANLNVGMNLAESMLGYLPSIVFFVPLPALFFGIALVPFFIERDRRIVILLMFPLMLFLSHFLIATNGLHGYGPRFLFEGLFALFILAARGFIILLSRSERLIGCALIGLFGALFIFDCFGLLSVLPRYRNYNRIYPELYQRVKELPLSRSAVLTTNPGWQGSENFAGLFDPHFKDSVFVRALDEGGHEQALNLFPERKIYVIRGRKIELRDSQ